MAEEFQAALIVKGLDNVTGSKGHKTAYLKGYQSAMQGIEFKDCPYMKKAGGWGYRRRWELGWRDWKEEEKNDV